MPVVETKKALEDKSVQGMEILVDNPASHENVSRFLMSKGFSVSTIEDGGLYRIQAAIQGVNDSKGHEGKKTLVYIDGMTMGRGDEELGKVLMTGCLKTLKELSPLPWRVIFINSGVKLVSRESQHIDVLKELAEKGVEILCCGTCLDYYGLKEKIGAGRVSNMYEILSSLSEASNVVRP